jgi:hypothetical protein
MEQQPEEKSHLRRVLYPRRNQRAHSICCRQIHRDHS